jgi:hypothetical protein
VRGAAAQLGAVAALVDWPPRDGAVPDLEGPVDDGGCRHLHRRTLAAVGWQVLHGRRAVSRARRAIRSTTSPRPWRASTACCCRPSRSGSANGTRRPCARAFPATPVDLIDGEWTSWYGSRAIAGLAGSPASAALRAALAVGRRAQPREAGVEIGDQVVRILEPGADAEQPPRENAGPTVRSGKLGISRLSKPPHE